MFEQDFIMRQIEVLGAVVAKLLNRKKDADYKGGIIEAKNACKEMVGIDSSVMLALSDESLVALLTRGGGYQQAIRCLMAGTLLNEQAQLNVALGNTDLARAGFRKALLLLVEAFILEGELRTDEHQAQISLLMEKVPLADLPVSLQPRIGMYQEMTKGH